ncbi:glycosyltransferase family 8 protein [Bradyrhizobium erythrophlei]|nr:glycosyltransferase family 8 protein [Bradyrhizobium erythrophlei]
MEVLCACDKLYLPHAATMLCSLLEHNSITRIHFLYYSINQHECAKLAAFVGSYGSKISFYEVRTADFDGLRVDKWASPAVYFRLLAPKLLPADLHKVLYLDSDIIVRRSLADLWNTDISGYALAAVPNFEDDARKILGLPDGTKYFNSGVLLVNLKFWRQYYVAEKAIGFVRENPDKATYWDQDALNATLVNKWIELPSEWNWQVLPSDPRLRLVPEAAVVHFVTAEKPWHWFSEHALKGEYHGYRRKTPWRQLVSGSVPWKVSRFLRDSARIIMPRRLRTMLRTYVG